jgi:5'-3' exonuclease
MTADSAKLRLLPPQGSRHMMAIDLSCFTRRAWHGHVNEHRQEPERAAPTALRNLARVLRARQPHCIVVAGEGTELFRAKAFPGYKAGRPPKPPELLDMERAVKAALADAGVAPYCVRGLEADDVLHAAVLLGIMGSIPVVVVADDKDAEQLVSAQRRVIIWDGDETVKDEAYVRERWGVAPDRLSELFAIAGDPGDGFPGVDGWGPKTAAKILNYAGARTLDVLLKDGGHWWVPEKYRAKFVANRNTIRMSYTLARLHGIWLSERQEFRATTIDPLEVAQRLADEAERLSR